MLEAAKLLDLEQLLRRKPKALSGGQRQRVAMGRAIVRKPQVFLMDEPLSNLDAKLRVQTRTQISSLTRRLATTTVYVTHDQVEALTMGDRIAVLKDGLLQQVGVPRDLYRAPVNLFVAGFIGSPAMNIFPAQVVEGGVQLGSSVVAGRASSSSRRRAPRCRSACDPRTSTCSLARGRASRPPWIWSRSWAPTAISTRTASSSGGASRSSPGSSLMPIPTSAKPSSSRAQPGRVHVFDPQTEQRLNGPVGMQAAADAEAVLQG